MGPTQYGLWFPPRMGGEVARDIDQLIDLMHWFMLLLFVGWGIFFVYCLVRFRGRAGHAAQYELVKAKPSKWLEVGVVIFEAVALLGFAIPAWARVKNQIPTGPDVVRARVVAEQFNWNFHYPGPDGKFGRTDPKFMGLENKLGLDPNDPDGKDDVWSLNQLHIPVNTDFVLEGSSKDVIHSVWIPVLRVKQDVIPGMRVPIWMRATHTTDELRAALARPTPLDDDFPARMLLLVCMRECRDAAGNVIVPAGGRFNDDVLARLRAAGVREVLAAPLNPAEVACAQLCGNSHYKMKGYVTIETREQFNAWLAERARGDEWEEDFEE